LRSRFAGEILLQFERARKSAVEAFFSIGYSR